MRPPLLETAEVALPRPLALRRAFAEVARVHADCDAALAGHSCPACGECCLFRVAGREPYLFPVEFAWVRRAWTEAGRPPPPPRLDGGCALLDASGRSCSVWPARAFGCRTFFCDRDRSQRPPPLRALHALSARLTRLSDALDGKVAPRRLSEWLADPPDEP